MFRPVGASSILLLFLAVSLVGQAKSPSNPNASKTNISQEAFVIEQFSRKEKFENDGTSSYEDTARVRIQSDAGVQQYGLLSFSYPSATGTFEIRYVRVRKPDGSVVETPSADVQDMAAQITREAPSYSDLHEKHVAVKGLNVGDVLEYQIQEHTTKPLAPGQFWTDYRFARDQIVLDEQLEFSVPRDRAVKIKSATIQPVISEADGYRIYTWHNSNLQHKDETNKKRESIEQLWRQAQGHLPRPDVLMSSFATWEDVGRWYGGLQQERVQPTPEIVSKAMELTKNAPDDEAKLRALYSYVSTNFHYIGIAFGIGRYQPHSAAVVLENQYGDCKDKHTLLASLLAAVGIPAYPALINVSSEVDADVPSPGQFDHVITVVPREGALIWLDSTAEVGPYRYLLPSLRNKHALAIWKQKPPVLVTTSADLPNGTSQTFNMDAKLDDAGTLEGSADFSARGDLEFVLRAGFRAVPLPQWKELGQRISFGFGFGGEVSEVTASSPEKSDQEFHFSYKYTRKEFGDWANRRILAPEPFITLPAPSEEDLLPIGPSWLGPPSDIQFQSRVTLPEGYRPELPSGVHLKHDFGQFDTSYDFKDGKLISKRHLKIFMSEVPATEREEYKRFAKAVQDDYGLYIPISSGVLLKRDSGQFDLNSKLLSKEQSNAFVSLTKPGPAADGKNSSFPTLDSLRNLPNSSNLEAMRLEGVAREAMSRHDVQSATSSLYRAVAADAKFARAWVVLGGLLLMQKQMDAGNEAFNKAIAADSLPAIAKAWGWSLMAAEQFETAVPVWQDYAKAHPEDMDGPANLASCLQSLKRYSEAALAYETALKTGGNRPNFQFGLGSVYLLAGEREKAAAAFSKLAEIDVDGEYFNDAAYQMANADLSLPLSLDYAKRAVHNVEEKSQKITLADLKVEDLRNIFRLAANWDTLGWANERISNLDIAERYLQASWKLTQDGAVASHLCHLYQRTHKMVTAIQMCSLAVSRLSMSGVLTLNQYQTEIVEAKKILNHLTGSAAKSKRAGDGSDIVMRERTFKLPRFLPGTQSAEFFVLLVSDGNSRKFKVDDVKFISGAEKMRLQGKQLKNIDFNVAAPDNIPTRFVRRGILGCYQYTGCSFVLLDPASVQSLD